MMSTRDGRAGGDSITSNTKGVLRRLRILRVRGGERAAMIAAAMKMAVVRATAIAIATVRRTAMATVMAMWGKSARERWRGDSYTDDKCRCMRR